MAQPPVQVASFSVPFVKSTYAITGRPESSCMLAKRPTSAPAPSTLVITQEGAFTPVRLETFAHEQELDLAGLIGRAVSSGRGMSAPGFDAQDARPRGQRPAPPSCDWIMSLAGCCVSCLFTSSLDVRRTEAGAGAHPGVPALSGEGQPSRSADIFCDPSGRSS